MGAGLPSAVLGVVILGLQVQVRMAVQPDLDSQKIAGFWREVGVASDHNLALHTPKRLEGLFLTLNGANLTVKVVYNNSGSCETEKIVGSEMDVSGKFVFPGLRELQVLDTDYEHYAILRVSLHWRGRNFEVLKYFSRSLQDENEPGFWKFRELTADTGLYLLARQGKCAQFLKEGRTQDLSSLPDAGADLGECRPETPAHPASPQASPAEGAARACVAGPLQRGPRVPGGLPDGPGPAADALRNGVNESSPDSALWQIRTPPP
ncbi:epididymal-specific lipocalin-8-like [Dugong dugon]